MRSLTVGFRGGDLDGVIASAAFASGDRFVCGLWRVSPIGVLHDVMWARPSGRRVLLVPPDEAAAFICGSQMLRWCDCPE